MIRFIVCLLLPSVAMAQIIKQPGLPPLEKFPSIGGYQSEQFHRSNIGLLSQQVLNELGAVKYEAQRSGVPPLYKPAIVKLVDQSIASAENLRNLANRGGGVQELRNADAAFDAAFNVMSGQVGRFGNYSSGMVDALARAQHADQQLHNALHQHQGGGQPPAWGMERLRRSSELLETQAEQLRNLAAEVPLLSPSARSMNFRAARFDRAADAAQSPAQLTDDFSRMLTNWREFGTAMTTVQVPHNVRLHATRMDSTMRSLAEMIPPPAGGWAWANPPLLNPGPVQPGPGFISRGAFVVGAGSGGGPRVRIFANRAGDSSYDFFAYDPNFQGGVRVAVADLTGDGVPDLVTAPGPGMAPLIRVFDGRTMRLLTEFLAFEPRFTAGVFVAAADRTATGAAWIAVGADQGGGPRVKVFDLATGKELDDFMAFAPQFRGGVRIALGDVNGDGVPDVLAVPGAGHDPRVRVFDGRNRAVLADFYAFDKTYTLGLNIAAADITRNGRADMIVGTEAGQPSIVRVFDSVRGAKIGEVIPYDGRFMGGVRVAAYDFDNNGRPDIVCSPGRDGNFPPLPIRVFSGENAKGIGEFYPFGNDFRGGAFIASR